MDPTKKRLINSSIIIVILTIAIIILLILAWKDQTSTPKTFEEKAKQLCSTHSSIKICNARVIEIPPESIEQKYKYLHKDGSQFDCQLNPETNSPECQAIAAARQNNNWNCTEIC